MTLPQQQRHTPGEVLDRERSLLRSRAWDAELVTWTVTMTGAPATGPQGYSINGIAINFGAAVPTDTNDTIAQGLEAAHRANTVALRIAVPTAATNVVTVREFMPGAGFVLTDPVSTGGTVTLADITVVKGQLLLGLAVALNSPTSIRRLDTGDTAANVFGVLVEGGDLQPNTGDPQQDDFYAEGDQVELIYRGPVPVRVEHAVAIDDPVFVRVTAVAPELAGAFRMDADGGDAVQLTNAAWHGNSFTDNQGRLLAKLALNLV